MKVEEEGGRALAAKYLLSFTFLLRALDDELLHTYCLSQNVSHLPLSAAVPPCVLYRGTYANVICQPFVCVVAPRRVVSQSHILFPPSSFFRDDKLLRP